MAYYAEKLIPTTDYGYYDLFSSKMRDIQYYVPVHIFYTVDADTEANLPGIASRFLQDRSLWIVLMIYNGIVDPISEVSIGRRIAIPKLRDLLAFLETDTTTSTKETILVF